MKVEDTFHTVQTLPPASRLACWMALGTVGLSGIALLGWVLDLPQLKNGVSRGAAMNPATAVLFLLAGASLWASALSRSRVTFVRLGRAGAAALLLISLFRVAELLFGWTGAVDQLLFSTALAREPGGSAIRMNGGIAFLLALLGVALLLVTRVGDLGRLIARSFAFFVGILAGLSVLSYVSRRAALSTPDAVVPVSLNTILGLLLVAVGVAAVAAQREGVLQPGGEIRVLRRRVGLGFGVALAILVVTAGLSVWGASHSREASRQRKDALLWRAELTGLLTAMQEAEAGQRGYLLTGDSAMLRSYAAATDSVARELRRIDSAAATDSILRSSASELRRLTERKAALLAHPVQLGQSGLRDSALRILGSGLGVRAMDSLRAAVRRLVAETEVQVEVWDRRLLSDDRFSVMASVVAGLLAVMFLALAGLAINRDLDKRARAEAAVRESERRLAQIIELIPNMVFLKEPKQLRFVQFNKAGEELLGFPRDALIGKNDYDFFPAEEADQFVAKDREVLGGREVVDIPEEKIHTKHRGVRILHTKKVAVRDDRGNPLFLLGISEDVTERKQVELAIREAKDAAEAANRAKSGFLAKMSHELRTPLNSIIGFSEILEEGTVGPLTEKQRRYVANVLVSGRSLLQLINDILDLSKVEAGRMELALSELDVAEVFEEVRAVLTPLAEKKHQTIVLKIEAGLPLLHADRAKIAQILYNLAGNAIKFTPEGGRVELIARMEWREEQAQEGEWLEVAVADTGIGIAEEDLERVFREFEQVGRAARLSQGGTGLGLALSRKLVEMHGGTIQVESTLGAGSTFRFRLPVQTSTPPLQTHLPANGNGHGPVALVIDDELQSRDLLAHYLAASGYRVVTATSGKGAVQSARECKPDVITLDILMPGRSGYLTLAELKSTPETRGIPVVIVTVSDDKELGFSLGAADWLVKPVQRTDLLAAIEQTIAREPAGQGQSALVIDDDPATVIFVTQLLEQRGYVVLSALSGKAGIDQAVRHRPSLIVLDLVMPEVTGFDVVRSLRQRAETRDIPILILTAKELTDAERDRLLDSVQSIVPKSGPDALLAELARLQPYAACRSGSPSA